MKPFFYLIGLLCFFQSTFAQSQEPRAIIYSIENGEFSPNDVEASEEALPSKLELLRFTSITSSRASELFASLKKDSRVRMRYPGGLCSSRRIHIQKVLRSKNIYSGKLYIRCPGNNGRMRLHDKVSGRYFTFSNFHDTNVVLVGSSYYIMDLQFQNSPVTLSNYLGQIETYQRLQHAKQNEMSAGICYWSISSPNLTYLLQNGAEGSLLQR